MATLTLLIHALNFILPALWMAVGMPLAARLLWPRAPARLRLATQMLLHAVLGVAVLQAGLWLLQRDGAMLTYLALVGVSAMLQIAIRR